MDAPASGAIRTTTSGAVNIKGNEMGRFVLRLFGLLALSTTTALAPAAAQDELPFQHSVEVYRGAGDDVVAFTVSLEQPFLAEEFEKSNFLRLRSDDDRAYLIYPKQTKFQQKHAEFYGRLRGEGTVQVRIFYETVLENIDGSRRVQLKEGVVEIEVPEPRTDGESIGSSRIFRSWAQKQNEHFAKLLEYYPDESFFQYVLLQSKARYGVEPPAMPRRNSPQNELETDLYEFFTGSLAIQQRLQRETLSSGNGVSDYNTHISSLQPPRLKSLDYETLLKEKREDEGAEPQVHDLAKLVPADQYLLQFNSVVSLGKGLDLASHWGDSLLNLYTVKAQDNRLEAKFEEQLCLQRAGLQELEELGAISEIALTGADPYLLEGTDLAVIMRVTDKDLFVKESQAWMAQTEETRPDLVKRDFNYRGHIVSATYTNDRVVSSFVVQHDDYIIYSNSHRSIRRIIDAATKDGPNLQDSLDYRYITTILPPSVDENTGYLFASEAFIRRVIEPSAKIAQKRRLQCFNNLVMQNNASMFYRLEFGRSPNSLSELIEGNFVDPSKIVCPHGGAYSFDAESDTCTCSLHNRLRYLTPNVELPVNTVSSQEADEYERYKQRYLDFWLGKDVFNPLAMKITVEDDVRLETCILPFANSRVYENIREMVDKNAQPIDTSQIAPSAIASFVMVPGRDNTAELLRMIPGVPEVVEEDPTLTDLDWLGDHVSVHICDGEAVLELDPTRLRTLELPFIGKASTSLQAAVGMLFLGVNLPAYATIEVEDQDKAQRLLEQFSERIFLKEGDVGGLAAELDSYRLPDYKEHTMYVLHARVYAASLRLHIALVGDQLVLATKPAILREVIDSSLETQPGEPVLAHVLFRVNPRALHHLYDDAQLYLAEKSRVACHRNIISIYNFNRLYNAPIDEIPQLSEAKYGVRYYCPDLGEYRFDSGLNQVICSVHGNREHSRQNPTLSAGAPFLQFLDSIDEFDASLRFVDDAVIATIEIHRHEHQDEAGHEDDADDVAESSEQDVEDGEPVAVGSKAESSSGGSK